MDAVARDRAALDRVWLATRIPSCLLKARVTFLGCGWSAVWVRLFEGLDDSVELLQVLLVLLSSASAAFTSVGDQLQLDTSAMRTVLWKELSSREEHGTRQAGVHMLAGLLRGQAAVPVAQCVA